MTPRTRVVAATVFGTALFLTRLFAQGNAPAYLAEMPSVERVLQAMRTSDPDETVCTHATFPLGSTEVAKTTVPLM